MSDNSIPAQAQSRSKPVRVLSSISAGATAAVTVLAAISEVPLWAVVAVGGIGTVLSVALGEYTKGQVTPWEDVAAKKTPEGDIIAGPAADDVRTGSGAQVTAAPGGVTIP